MGIGLSNIILDMSLQARETNAKINNLDHIQLKSYCIVKEVVKNIYMIKWYTWFTISDKRIITKIYKELMQVNTEKTNTPFKNGRMACIHIFSKNTHRWATDTWIGAQYH